MANHQGFILHTLTLRGGWPAIPVDDGNCDFMGLSLTVYTAYCRKMGYPYPTENRLIHISQETWTDVVKQMFWNRWKADEIQNQSLAEILVDWFWMSGFVSVYRMQEFLAVKVDGLVGPETIGALNRIDAEATFYRIQHQRVSYAYELVKTEPQQELFLDDWLSRIYSFSYTD